MKMLDRSDGLYQKISKFFFRKSRSEISGEIALSYRSDLLSMLRFHRNILQACFHKPDLDSVAEFIAGVKIEDYVLIVAEQNNEIVGGIVVEHSWSMGKKVMLIAWVAVHPDHRGKDVGTLLIEEARRYAITNEALVLLGEVENPEFFEEEKPAFGNPRKRVKFYSRFGCQRLEVPYFVPALSDSPEHSFGVMLSLFPLNEEQAAATHLNMPELFVFMEEFVGSDSKEGLALVEACKGTVALIPYSSLL